MNATQFSTCRIEHRSFDMTCRPASFKITDEEKQPVSAATNSPTQNRLSNSEEKYGFKNSCLNYFNNPRMAEVLQIILHFIQFVRLGFTLTEISFSFVKILLNQGA